MGESMNRHFFRELANENPRLLQKMMQFNAPEARAPHLPEGKLWEAVARHADLVALLDRTRTVSHSPQAPVYWGFTKEPHRLAFLSTDEIDRLGRIVAAAVYAEELAKTVDRANVLAVKAFLGSDLYGYALTRGRFQIGALRQSLVGLFPDGTLAERLAWMARLSVQTVRAAWPQELQAKTQEAFDALTWPQLPFEVAIDDGVRRQLWYFMKKIILREFDQKWARYFG